MTIEDRYGKTKKIKIDKIVGFSFAALLVGGGILFLATGGMPTASKEIEFRDVAHSIDSDSSVSITYEVTTDANRDMICALDALSPSYATVGLKLVQIPANNERKRVFVDNVVTMHRATTVTVRTCWFPEKEQS